MNDSPPNVLMVILDSVRPEWLSCYGSAAGTSPNIDQVAGEGIVFEKAISPSAWTFPAMASVFTGMLPTKHGGHDEHERLDSPYPTLAEILGRHSYDTAAFSYIPYVGPMTNLDRGFRTMSNLQRGEVSGWSTVFKGIGRLHRAISHHHYKPNNARIAVGEAVRWLGRRRDPGKPFFLYIHFDQTHAPYLPPARYRRRFARLSRRQMRQINQDKHLFVSGAVKMSPRDFELLHALARGVVAFTDAWLGRLLDYMQRKGILQDTIIVIAADHGDNVGEHGLLCHGLCLYDTLIHVPLVVRPPDSDSPKRVRPIVSLIDLMPTLLGMAGIDEPEVLAECQGCDLMGAIRTGQFPEFAVSEVRRPNQTVWQRTVPGFMPEFRMRFDRALRSYRTNSHKYIWSSDGRHELFDLEADPGEERNLIDDQPELVTRMQGQLDTWLASFRHTETPEPTAAVDDQEVLRRLRDLGYIA